jgi:hypothetical protein
MRTRSRTTSLRSSAASVASEPPGHRMIYVSTRATLTLFAIMMLCVSCGGRRLSAHDFRVRANTICTKLNRQSNSDTRPTKRSLTAAIARIEAGIAELEHLRPPSRDEPTYNDFLTRLQSTVAFISSTVLNSSHWNRPRTGRYPGASLSTVASRSRASTRSIGDKKRCSGRSTATFVSPDGMRAFSDSERALQGSPATGRLVCRDVISAWSEASAQNDRAFAS